MVAADLLAKARECVSLLGVCLDGLALQSASGSLAVVSTSPPWPVLPSHGEPRMATAISFHDTTFAYALKKKQL